MRRLGALLVVLLAVMTASASAQATDPGTTLTQPVTLDWDRMSLDVVIVPPAYGQLSNGDGALGGRGPTELVPTMNSYVAATEKAIEDWRKAIRTFGSDRLKRLVLNVYVLGRDTVPSPVLQEIEILIAYHVTTYPVLGTTVNGPIEVNGVAIGDNPRCKILNSTFGPMNMTYADMYWVAGHEFGHCLGIDHVAPGGEQIIRDDTMNALYRHEVGAKGNRLLCMSNLNVVGLELAYDGKTHPKSATMPASQYRKISC